MIFFRKLWIAFSVLAFGGLALMPVVAAGQGFYGDTAPQYNATSPSPQQTITSPAPQQTITSPSPQQTVTSPSTQTVGGLQNPLGQVTGVCQLLKIVLNIAILLGIPIAMFFMVYAGFKLVLARGNPTELQKARSNLVWTIAGIAIFVGVWFIVQVIANTLGALGVQILGDCR